MSVIATALKHMMAAGMDPTAIVAAVADLEAQTAAAAPAPSKGALRTRRWRERQEASQSVTCDAPETVVTESVTPPPAPSPFLPPDPQPTPTHTPEGNTRARKAAAWPVPEGVDPEHWRDLLANRRTKRLPNTPTAHKRILGELLKLSDGEWPPGRIVQHAAERGWGAIFDPRPRDRQNGQRPHHHDRNGSRNELSSMARALAESELALGPERHDHH